MDYRLKGKALNSQNAPSLAFSCLPSLTFTPPLHAPTYAFLCHVLAHTKSSIQSCILFVHPNPSPLFQVFSDSSSCKNFSLSPKHLPLSPLQTLLLSYIIIIPEPALNSHLKWYIPLRLEEYGLSQAMGLGIQIHLNLISEVPGAAKCHLKLDNKQLNTYNVLNKIY